MLLQREQKCKNKTSSWDPSPPRKDVRLMSTETLDMLLNKLPRKARQAFRIPDIQHNLIACAELIDAGCSVYLHKRWCEIEYEGEVPYKGWRDTINRL